jgi:hypothetical protein
LHRRVRTPLPTRTSSSSCVGNIWVTGASDKCQHVLLRKISARIALSLTLPMPIVVGKSF